MQATNLVMLFRNIIMQRCWDFLSLGANCSCVCACFHLECRYLDLQLSLQSWGGGERRCTSYCTWRTDCLKWVFCQWVVNWAAAVFSSGWYRARENEGSLNRLGMAHCAGCIAQRSGQPRWTFNRVLSPIRSWFIHIYMFLAGDSNISQWRVPWVNDEQSQVQHPSKDFHVTPESDQVIRAFDFCWIYLPLFKLVYSFIHLDKLSEFVFPSLVVRKWAGLIASNIGKSIHLILELESSNFLQRIYICQNCHHLACFSSVRFPQLLKNCQAIILASSAWTNGELFFLEILCLLKRVLAWRYLGKVIQIFSHLRCINLMDLAMSHSEKPFSCTPPCSQT